MILEDGTIGSLKVLQADAKYPEFSQNAIEAIRQWRYEPATANHQPVPAFFTIFVEFKLH